MNRQIDNMFRVICSSILCECVVDDKNICHICVVHITKKNIKTSTLHNFLCQFVAVSAVTFF